MTWTQVYVARREVGCVCMWVADLRLMWRVCAMLDLAPTCAFIQVSVLVRSN